MKKTHLKFKSYIRQGDQMSWKNSKQFQITYNCSSAYKPIVPDFRIKSIKIQRAEKYVYLVDSYLAVLHIYSVAAKIINKRVYFTE